MKVVHISQTPIAGAAWAASEAFKEAGYDSCCIAHRRYKGGREFPSDYLYPPNDEALVKLWNAEVIFCHQGRPYRQSWYPKNTATVFIYHSQPSHVWRGGEARWPWAVIGQYQPRLYGECDIVPNLVPVWQEWYEPGPRANDLVQIAYSPSNKRLSGWDDKGYGGTVEILNSLDADIDVITGVPLDECLQRKAQAHIVVDECVTGSYHRSSLEGLALGCVVVNNCDAACAANVRKMTGKEHPFVVTDMKHLAETLQEAIDKGPGHLTRWGTTLRDWFCENWNPTVLINHCYRPLMEKALHVRN